MNNYHFESYVCAGHALFYCLLTSRPQLINIINTMAENYKPAPPSRSAGQLPPLRGSINRDDEMSNNRNRIMFIQNEMEDLQGQREQIDYKLQRLYVLENDEDLEYQQLVILKKQRKDLESQSQAISNRIEHLKNLKDDLWKRIRYMHSCAQEIESLKRKNDERKKEKMHAKLVSEKMRLQKGDMDDKGKKERKLHISRRKELMEYQKKERAEQLRKEREINEKRYMRIKTKQIRQNELKKQEVHRTELNCTAFKKLFEQQKKEKVLKRLMDDKKKERVIIKQCQKKIDELRRREDDWMAEVRETEKMFFKANDRLKKVMNIEDEPDQGTPEEDDLMQLHREDLPDDDDDNNQLVKRNTDRENKENSQNDASEKDISVE